MKRNFTLFKTLLVAVGLCVGSSAWAAEPTLTLTSSYAVDNYGKLCYLEFGAKTIDDGSTYEEVVNVGGYTAIPTRGIQNQTASSATTPITITKSIKKGDLIIMQAGQTATHGMNITVGSAVNNPIKNDGYYVYYVTSDAESFTINLGRLNYVRAMLILRPSTTDYVVNAVTPEGKLLKELATGTYTADEKIYYPYGIMKDGVCYKKDKNSTEPYWGVTNLAAGLRTIVYTANDWAYYAEMEDMNGASLGGTRYNLADRASNGGWKYMNKNAKMYSSGLTAGTYSITVYGRNSKSASRTPPVVILRSSGGTYTNTVATFGSWGVSATGEYTAENVIIPEDGYAFCLFQAEYNSDIDLDYVYAVKTSDDVTVSKTLSAAGWSTYCSPYILDFSGDIENLDDAYIVTGATGSVLKLESVKGKKVPAGTGLLLKGTAGQTCKIPVAGSSDAIAGNQLVGVTSQTTLDLSGGKQIWVLMISGSQASFKYTTKDTFTLSANSAYLPVDDTFAIPSSGVKSLSFFGDDASTAINGVECDSAVDGAMYNLSGQRVGKDFRGIVIVNGKKFMNK